MRDKLRRMLALCAALVLAGSLAACGGSQTDAETETAPEDIVETLPEDMDAEEAEAEGIYMEVAEEDEPDAGTDSGETGGLGPDRILAEYQASDAEAALWDSEELAVTLQRIYTDDEATLCLDINLENRTDEPMTVYAEGVAVNRIMVPGMFADDEIPALESMDTTLELILPENGQIGTVGEIQMSFAGYGSETFTGQLDTDRIRIVLDEENADYQAAEGLGVVYEDDDVRITAYPRLSDEYSLNIPLCVENKTGTDISVSCGTVEDGEQELNAALTEDIFSGCCVFTEIRLVLEELSDAGVTEVGDVTTTMTGTDMFDFSILFTTGDISLPSGE